MPQPSSQWPLLSVTVTFYREFSPLYCNQVNKIPRGFICPWFLPTMPMRGGAAGRFSLVVWLLWRTHRGGLVPRVHKERSDRPFGVTLNLCAMRRYYLGEGGPGVHIKTFSEPSPRFGTWYLVSPFTPAPTFWGHLFFVSFLGSYFLGSYFLGGHICCALVPAVRWHFTCLLP